MARIDSLLMGMAAANASDLHLVVGQKPKYRVHGQVVLLGDQPVFDAPTFESYLFEILSADERQRFITRHDLDVAYGIGAQYRYRCNYFYQRTGYGAVFRLIPSKIQTLDELNMPPVLKDLSTLRSGLVLVTGPTGCGKSTTLAAMIDHINETQRRHILTIEDPVEFVHSNKKSVVTHRQVGIHTKSFAAALRAVTRQDADVVLVGELRDLETMALALSAAAMGMVVFGTLHTSSAPKTVDRVIDNFPSEQQPQVRAMLAESLRGVVCQELLRRVGGKGRVAAIEVLVSNRAVSSIIREGNIEKIVSVIQSGGREGMQMLDDDLERLVKKGEIDPMDAYMKASDKGRFDSYKAEHS
jgi:twitching motility protein PilT